jgi:hypothetical protein
MEDTKEYRAQVSDRRSDLMLKKLDFGLSKEETQELEVCTKLVGKWYPRVTAAEQKRLDELNLVIKRSEKLRGLI